MTNSAGRLRAVLDTNVTVSGLIALGGAPALILDALLRNEFDVFESVELFAELTDVLGRERTRRYIRRPPPVVTQLLNILRNRTIVTANAPPLPVHVRDPKDDMVLACALAAGADVIVTGDADLLALDGDPALGTLRILRPAEFLALLDARTPP